MPPRQIMTRDAIRRAAFALVRERGVDALNARNIAGALGCSTQPIFSCYENMAELRTDVFRMAELYHDAWFGLIAPGGNSFADAGIKYIDFALEEPNLFKLLFLTDAFADGAPGNLGMDGRDARAAAVMSRFADPGSPRRMLTDMWIYAHGLASMLVANRISIDRAEIRRMVADMYHMIEKKNREECS